MGISDMMDGAWAALIAFSVMGLLMSFWGMADALVDLHCIRIANTNGTKKTVVWMHMRNEATRMFLQASWVITGFINVFDPRIEIPSEYKVWSTGVLVVGATVLLILSAADRRDRFRLLRAGICPKPWDGTERRQP
jgi:hypothetical protein